MKAAPAAQPDDASTTRLGDWFATPLMWRPQAVMLVNTSTMLPVLTPLASRETRSGRRVARLADKRAEKAAGSFRQMKITLNGSKPPIWRRVVVDGEQPLQHLHEVIQAAFGWFDCHLHEFEIGTRHYGIPDEDDFRPVSDERTVSINKALGSAKKLRYVYDFGDYWVHDITVETAPATPPTVPACTGGKRACPPEDCGGIWGYRELLTILADPTHPEHRERSEWLVNPIDPDAFDPDDFEENLKLLRLAAFDPFD